MVQGTLDPQFFEQVDAISRNDDTSNESFLFHCYESMYPHSTMVLYSKVSHTPLAALTLKGGDYDCSSIFSPRDAPKGATETFFQGMLNQDNSPFEFVITNLSDLGSINFNILHLESGLSQAVAYGINEVNELCPNQSYVVKANQRDNRKMILRGKTLTAWDPITMQERKLPATVDDTENGTSSAGLSFFLSVAPEITCLSLTDLFAEGTYWKVTSGFVRKIKKPQQRNARERRPSSIAIPVQGLDDSQRSTLSTSESVHSTRSKSLKMTREPSSLQMASMRQICDGPLPYRGRRRSSGRRTMPSFAAIVDDDYSIETTRSTSQVPNLISRGSLSDDTSRMRRFPHRVRRHLSGCRYPNIGQTQAADLSSGDAVRVTSVAARRDYDFDRTSAPTIICMSIWKEMELSPIDGLKLQSILREQAHSWIKRENLQAIPTDTYPVAYG